jgi:hypothetical protein
MSSPGAYLPAHPDRKPLLIGAVAIPLPDPSAVVSHLRKMTVVSHRTLRGATALAWMSPLIPLFTGLVVKSTPPVRGATPRINDLTLTTQQRTNDPIKLRERRHDVIGAGLSQLRLEARLNMACSG